MLITGVETTDELKLHLTRLVYTAIVCNSSILKIKDVLKIDHVEKIVQILKKRTEWSGVRAFLNSYPCFFLITEESNSTVIKPIAIIEFCRDFDGKRGCSKNLCSKLHVCRHFVKGKCTFGPRCKKPHHFEGSNTREVLRKHFLDFLTDEQLREFLCRNVQHLLEQDSLNSEVPKSLEICKYYNVATGCTRDFCPYIHVCRFYAEEGNCKFGAQCIRKHGINNIHSRILLNRYQMDNLTDAQVMAYLKIKADRREDQTEKSPPPILNQNNVALTASSKFPSNYSNSLPNIIMSNIQAALANRKISNTPLQPFSMPTFDTSSSANCKLPSTAGYSKKIPVSRPTITHTEGSLTQTPQTRTHSRIYSSSDHNFKSSSYTSSADYLSHTNGHDFLYNRTNHHLNRYNSETALVKDRQPIYTPLDVPFLHYNQFQQYNECEKPSYQGLGLNNLSPPTTSNFHYENFKQSHHLFTKSKSFEHFNAVEKEEDSKIHTSDTFFSNRSLFTRASSSDICSPTGSLSSINGLSISHPLKQHTPPEMQNGHSPTKQELVMSSYNEKRGDSDILLSYYRTQSLPNFSYLSGNGHGEKEIIEERLDCTCQKNTLCLYFLRGKCNLQQCKKLHTTECFQWQIYSRPLNSINGYEKKKAKWINVAKNENLKLESDYCSVEIDQSEMNFFGENVVVNFDDMVGVGRCEISTNGKSCDLSSWLLQASEEPAVRISSQDNVVYKVRRLSTVSSVSESADVALSTTWCWYWEDSFGMWRGYPLNRDEAVVANKTCYTNEIELKYLEGPKQCALFDEKTMLDFKSMLQINCHSSKQKKIRRRPKFFPMEIRDIRIDTSAQMKDVRRPWYWEQSRVTMHQHSGEYELITLQETSEMHKTVVNQFRQSESLGKILSIKSVQNAELWSRFIRFRSEMNRCDLKVAERFVFRAAEAKSLSGICQQGFQICSCNATPNEIQFTQNADKKLLKPREKDESVQYIFGVRMSVPLSDLNDYPLQNNVICRHGNQVYPEFLIVLKT